MRMREIAGGKLPSTADQSDIRLRKWIKIINKIGRDKMMAYLSSSYGTDSRIPCFIVVEATKMRAFISIQIAQDGDSGWSILSRKR